MRELLVQAASRESLDAVLRQIGGLVGEIPVGNNIWPVRAFPPENINFLRFAIERQGYGKIVGERVV